MWIKEMKATERPREKMQRFGVTPLSDAELIAVLLRTGSSSASAMEVAHRLIKQKSLLQLSTMHLRELTRIPGIGSAKASSILAAFELGRRVKHNSSPQIMGPSDIANVVAPLIVNASQEHFIGVFLNTQHQVIHSKVLFIGTLNASLVHPREVFKEAVKVSAASVVVAHNHPSGDLTPSPADIEMTKQLKEAAQMIHIPLLDHVIVGEVGYLSFSELGLL
jgi:DNA repair protein RadC